MEYCELGDLGRFLEQVKSISETAVQDVARQLPVGCEPDACGEFRTSRLKAIWEFMLSRHK